MEKNPTDSAQKCVVNPHQSLSVRSPQGVSRAGSLLRGSVAELQRNRDSRLMVPAANDFVEAEPCSQPWYCKPLNRSLTYGPNDQLVLPEVSLEILYITVHRLGFCWWRL